MAVKFIKQMVESTLAPHHRGASVDSPARRSSILHSTPTARGQRVWKPERSGFNSMVAALLTARGRRCSQASHYKDWLASDVNVNDFVTGCQGYRNLGKFLFTKLEPHRIGAHECGETGTPNLSTVNSNRRTFVIFCTLAGGTGSGCLLDFSFLLRPDVSGREYHADLGLPGLLPRGSAETWRSTIARRRMLRGAQGTRFLHESILARWLARFARGPAVGSAMHNGAYLWDPRAVCNAALFKIPGGQQGLLPKAIRLVLSHRS